MDEEIWETIKNYENEYIVSNFGRVMSLPQERVRKSGTYKRRGKILKSHKNSMGYLRVQLKGTKKREKYFVHRLVAQVFIPNIENKPYINHKDCNPLNNHVENLEWCTPQENVDYMIKLGRNKRTPQWINRLNKSLEKTYKPVIGINVKTGEILKFKCIQETKSKNFRPGDVCKCCKGERQTAGGYSWRYI
jgi:hypothetical protein